MKSNDGFVQVYNAQAGVDAHAQIIVAQDVTQSPVDCGQLVPMVDAVEKNLEGSRAGVGGLLLLLRGQS
jgi:hypothetical protein